MSPVLKEISYPPSYRQAEVAQIFAALRHLRSIAVTGLAGMGKSNIVRFVASNTRTRERYLGRQSSDFAFTYVDCASLPDSSEDSVLEEFLAQLHLEGLATESPSLPPSLRSLRRILRAQILGMDVKTNLVVVLDDFDRAAKALGEPFFNYLCHLRNARPRSNVSYVFATRRPMGHLYELQELLDDGCIVGPFHADDANGSLDRDEERLGCEFTTAQRLALVGCTGGHPGLLKNAAELVAVGEVRVEQDGNETARALLRSGKIRIVCEDLWRDLTKAEQGILANLAVGIPLGDTVDKQALSFLQMAGLLSRSTGQQDTVNASLFCPLFQAFVVGMAGHSGEVRIAPVSPNKARIEAQGRTISVEVSPLLYALLVALAEAEGGMLSRDDIVERVYGGSPCVSDQSISQLVQRLRNSLNPHARRMANDNSFTCVETIRGVGFRFHG